MSSCQLAERGPYWITEGETLELSIACGSGVDLAEREILFAGLPGDARYEYDAVTGSFAWTPQLDDAAVYQLHVVLPESGERLELIVGVADRHDHPDNHGIRDSLRYTDEYGLPVLFLDSAPTESVYRRSRLTFRGRRHRIEAKLRGSSSLNYPKKNYTLEFDNDDLFDAPDLGMGFVDRKKMVLTSTFDDNSYVRQRLAFELWDRMAPEHIRIHSASVVLYVDNSYHGLYTLTDHVDRHLMRGHGLLDSGNLYKARSYDADFRVKEDPLPLHAGLTKAEGLPTEDFADLWSLITFVDTASDEEFAARAGELMHLQDYRDWWLFVTMIRADDSASKNSYHYIEYPGAPARYIPWDFNASFGQTWTTHRTDAEEIRSYARYNRLFERLLASSEQKALIQQRCLSVLDGAFSVETVEATLDRYLAEIDASARRDWAKWEESHRNFARWDQRTDFTSFDEEVAFVREWYLARWIALKEWCSAVEPSQSAAAPPSNEAPDGPLEASSGS